MNINKLEYSQDRKSILVDIDTEENTSLNTASIVKIAIQNSENVTLDFPDNKAFIITDLTPDKYKITNNRKYVSSILISDMISSIITDTGMFVIHIISSNAGAPIHTIKAIYNIDGIINEIVHSSIDFSKSYHDNGGFIDLCLKKNILDSFVLNNDVVLSSTFWNKYIKEYN